MRSRGALIGITIAALAVHALGAAAPDWTVPDAPYRAVVQAQSAPQLEEGGYLIDLPEFGKTRPNASDAILTDAKGNAIPLAFVWNGKGRHMLLLARSPGTDVCYLYFGGDKTRAHPTWTPKVSLLLETR